MDLKTALSNIHPPKGVTTIIGAVYSGDFSSIRGADDKANVETALEQAQQKLKQYKNALDNCKSDFAYWGILGDVGYWQSVVDILKAAKITGSDNLPDIAAPNLKNCVVMDAIGKVEDYGRNILKAAQKTKESSEQQATAEA